MAELDNTNEMFGLAVDLVNQSNRNIFLTGKAGTGKTTFLRYIKENTLKQAAVVAPTGVAAINAGGSTIHAFFQLPFSPYLPEARGSMHQNDATNKHTLLGKVRLNSERIKILRQLELLIIDEISMVRCDVLDAIDVVLRHFRSRHTEPFGGVQVLAIGDMYQLPPVAVDEEWNLLSQYYRSPYFFSSRVMQQTPPAHVEFEKIYRQSDRHFIDLLNQVRNNALTSHGKQLLEGLYNPDFKTDKEDGYIILTTHNHKADVINGAELAKLAAASHSFKAEITGDFSEKAFPADEVLQLKEGAQVMFIRNDKEKIKRYYNGKIGTITRIDGDNIFVQCKDEAEAIEVQKETWDNIRYALNKQTNQLEENTVGSFTQYPLRLAWAITIHKSQGLTFEKAVIDAGSAFASGQVYVALSRCTSLEGIVLQSKITANSVKSDRGIADFSENATSFGQLRTELHLSKKRYQEDILLNVFDLMPQVRSCNELKNSVTNEFNAETLPWVDQLLSKFVSLQDVAIQFKGRLNTFFLDPAAPEENTALQERIKDASVYFARETAELMEYMFTSPAVTDSKVQAKAYTELLKHLFLLVAEKKHLLQGLSSGFRVDNYYKQKTAFTVPAFSGNAYATASIQKTESAHPELHYQLRQLRNKLCEMSSLPVYIVASTKSIDEMVQFLPLTKDELIRISGFGKAKVEKYGAQFLDVIVAYCSQHGLGSLIHEKDPKRERKAKDPGQSKQDTKAISYQLYKEGNRVADIAKARNLTAATIEAHLASYVETGMIPVEELLSMEKLAFLQPFIADHATGAPLGPVMEKLENKVTYGELRFAIAAHEWEKAKEIA